jgi:hypothetical protein
MDPYITALYQIVAVGQNANSYKFALWRALAHIAPNKSVISKLDLAPLFLGYYWPLQLQYRIRQGTDPDKDPSVMRRIRELLAGGTIEQGESLKNFKRRNVSEYERLVARVAREAFDDVIPRFHVVRRKAVDPKIFTFTGRIGAAGSTIETNNRRQTIFDRSQ